MRFRSFRREIIFFAFLVIHFSQADKVIVQPVIGKKLSMSTLTAQAAIGTTSIETMYDSETTWRQLEDTGANLTLLSNRSLFFRALAAGVFVGFGGILTTSVGFDMGSSPPWMAGNGLARFMSGAVGFPLTILLVTMSNNGAWTGDALLAAMAWVNK